MQHATEDATDDYNDDFQNSQDIREGFGAFQNCLSTDLAQRWILQHSGSIKHAAGTAFRFVSVLEVLSASST